MCLLAEFSIVEWGGTPLPPLTENNPAQKLGGEQNRKQEFVFRFRQCRYRISGRKKPENLIFFLSIFIQKVKVTPLNQFRELQIFWLFSCQISYTGTAGTGIQILDSCSAHPPSPPYHQGPTGSQYPTRPKLFSSIIFPNNIYRHTCYCLSSVKQAVCIV